MLDRAINLFETDLTSLAWVQNYGGMTKLVNRENDQVKYPVSIHANFKDCFANGIYDKMMPSKATSSLIYFEEILKPKFGERAAHGSHKVDQIEGAVTSLSKIAAETGISEHTLKSCLKKLRQAGLINYGGRKNCGGKMGFTAYS